MRRQFTVWGPLCLLSFYHQLNGVRNTVLPAESLLLLAFAESGETER